MSPFSCADLSGLGDQCLHSSTITAGVVSLNYLANSKGIKIILQICFTQSYKLMHLIYFGNFLDKHLQDRLLKVSVKIDGVFFLQP